MDVVLDVWEFRDWLDDKPDVGTAGNPNQCPLARYATEVLHLDYVSVDRGGIAYGGSPSRRSLRAPWIERFVGGVDSVAGTVTGRRALEILDSI